MMVEIELRRLGGRKVEYILQRIRSGAGLMWVEHISRGFVVAFGRGYN
jgi:hypothetical protein